MAIYSSVPPPTQQDMASTTQASPAQPTQPIDIETWTVSALESLSVSPFARGTGVTLSIALDSSQENHAAREARAAAYKAHKEPLRRDSQKRREALLKGKEGSRRRQRWENGESPGILPGLSPSPTQQHVRVEM
jgi:hypothetical protein